MNNNTPDPMEDWMATWQATEYDPNIIAGFQKKMWRRRWIDYGAIAVIALGILVFVHALITRPSLFVIAASAYFVPYFIWTIARMKNRLEQEREHLPLSGTEFVEALEHNLELREKYSKWEQRTIIPALVAAGFIMLWQLDSGEVSPRRMLIVFGFCVPSMVFAWYGSFISTPKKLLEERASIETLKDTGNI